MRRYVRDQCFVSELNDVPNINRKWSSIIDRRHFYVSPMIATLRTMDYKYMGKKNQIATDVITTIDFLKECVNGLSLFFKF